MEFEHQQSVIEAINARERKQRSRLFGGLNELLKTFSPSERLLLYVFSVALAGSAFMLLANVNQALSTEIPTRGGTLIEGAVGTPRFINPLLAISQPDQDLTTLVYSGLLRADPNGTYVPDLADRYEISDDGTVYTFHLRDTLTFHDGEPLSSADVLYTITLAQNPDIKSARRADWEGVSIATPDEHTIVFTLPHPYAPFLENATIGILPKHVWNDVSAEEFPFDSLNTHPIGSGPYRIVDSRVDATGAPIEYTLAAFNDFAISSPNLSRIKYRTYANDEELLAAFDDNDIESFVASSPKSLPRELQESEDIQPIPLARVFAIFLNQNHAPALTSLSVREALDTAVDKEDIIAKVLGGYGKVLTGPIPPGLIAESTTTKSRGDTETSDRIQEARDILSRGGWTFNEAAGVWEKNKTKLTLTLATADTEELVATAHAVADAWGALGVPTSVQIYPLSEFNQTILRPRAYDAILFGEVVSRSLDLFAFWHSSQRNDPGLNLSQYANADIDRILASSRAETDPEKRHGFLNDFLRTLDEDRPAVFLYTPTIAYIVPERIQGIQAQTLSSPSDRFLDVHHWYRDTERVWDVFTRDTFISSTINRIF